jgi:membrane protease YdiL (CAAX protease family)
VSSAGRFFLLVVVLSAPLWLLGGDAEILAEEGVGLPLSALMFLAPFVAALVLVGQKEGRMGVLRLLRSLVDGRGLRGRWLVPTLGLLPLLYAVSYMVHRLQGRVSDLEIDPTSLLVLTVVFWVTAAAEEVGWTGYAVESLSPSHSALVTALIVGVVWAGVHVIPDLQAGRDWGWIVSQRIHTVALRVLIVWLYNKTGRTLAAPVLFHASDNVSVFSLFPGGEDYEPFSTAALTVAAAALVVARYGPRTLSRAE